MTSFQIRNHWPLVLIGLLVVVALALFAALQLRPAPAAAPAVVAPIRGPELSPPIPVMIARPTPSAAELAAGVLRPEDLLKALLRTGIRPEGAFPSVDVVLADAVYFAVTERELPAEIENEPSLVFYLSENGHDDLPESPPAPLLKIDGEVIVGPVETVVLADSYHHRTTALRYAGLSADGAPLVTDETAKVELYFAGGDWGETSSNVLKWKLPIEFAQDISSRDVVLGLPEPVAEEPEIVESDVAEPVVAAVVVPSSVPTRAEPGPRFMSWAAILAIMAGMLTVLSPCLIQLVVYYTATLAGVSIENGSQGQLDLKAAQRHIVRTGLVFAIGFTAIYTAGGAAAGYIGQSLDKLGLLTSWMRPLSIAAGVVIVLMALRMAWNARAPLVCRMPMSPVFGAPRRTGMVASLLMGMSFAGGCMACFSATVLPALLLYAGSTGSVLYGALLLLVFSLGVTIPCLLLAFGISRAQPYMSRLSSAGPMLGLVSAAVMAAFGIIMITDQFHVVSGYVYQVMGLS